MELSFTEKLILIMLSDIHASLKIKGGIDPQFVKKAIFDEEAWSLTWKYPGIVGSGHAVTPPHVSQVLDILEMWELLEESYQRLPSGDKAKVNAQAKMFGSDVRFSGFDGNNESEYLGAAGVLIDDLDRFSTFSRRDLNSHMPLVPKYERMVAVYQPMRSAISGGSLNAAQIIQILNA